MDGAWSLLRVAQFACVAPMEEPSSGADARARARVAAPEARAAIEAKIGRLRELGTRYHPFEIVSRVAAFHLFSFEGFEPDEDGVKSEAQVEYLLSLFLAQPFPVSTEFPPNDAINECMTLLDELHREATFYYTMLAESRPVDLIEEQLQVIMRLNRLHVRGDAYHVHTRQTFSEIAPPHDKFLRARCGFSSQEFLSAIDEAEQSMLAASNEHMTAMFAKYEELETRYGNKQPTEGPELEAYHATLRAWGEAFEGIGGKHLFEVKPRHATDTAVFRQLAMAPGDNADFLTKAPKWPGWPLNPTRVADRPLVEHEGKFYLFHPQILARNILSLLERVIMEADQGDWRDSFLVLRDEHAEARSLALISVTLPSSRAYSNLYYWVEEAGERKWVEADAIVVYDDTLLIVEVKAGTLAAAAQRGAIKSLRSSVEETIDKAYLQALRTRNYVRSAPEVIFYDRDQREVIRVRQSQFERMFLVGVVSDPYSNLATQLPLLRKFGFLVGTEWPWIVTLNDLRAITELCPHPTMFLFYILRRVAANRYPQLHASDELELFGHFIRRGLYFENDAEFKRASMYVVNTMSADIDSYYRARELGDKNATRPDFKTPEVLYRFIRRMETLRPPHFASAALLLLQFGSETRDQISRDLPGVELYFQKNRVARWMMFRSDVPEIESLIMACAPVDSPRVNQSVAKAGALKNQQQMRRTLLILWQPPSESGNFAIQYI